MKHLLLTILIIISSNSIFSQVQEQPSLLSKALGESYNSNFLSFDIYFRSLGRGILNEPEGAFDFIVDNLEFELKGNITDNIYFQLHYLAGGLTDEPTVLEHLPEGFGIMGVGANVGNFNFFVGKQDLAYGGFEYIADPINVYYFSELVAHTTANHTGLTIGYKFSSKNQLQAQIMNAYIDSFSNTFGHVPLHINRAIIPALYILNWNASFFRDIYSLRWSVSYASVARNKGNALLAFGNKVKLTNKLSIFGDIYYSIDGLDNRNLLRQFSPLYIEDNLVTIQDARYTSIVSQLRYNTNSRLSLLGKITYDTASVANDNATLSKGRYSTTCTYQLGAEYRPFRDSNLKLFIHYLNHRVNYEQRAIDIGFNNTNNNIISIGVHTVIGVI